MRILIVSDTHRYQNNLCRAIEETGKIDMLIHLGDVEGKDKEIASLVDCPIHMVRGNNDFMSPLPSEEEFFVGEHHFFITHGHAYRVGMTEDFLKEEARGRGADIVIYGHTHIPVVSSEDNLLTLNPGSITYPRQSGRKPSYILMKIDGAGKVNCEIKYL